MQAWLRTYATTPRSLRQRGWKRDEGCVGVPRARPLAPALAPAPPPPSASTLLCACLRAPSSCGLPGMSRTASPRSSVGAHTEPPHSLCRVRVQAAACRDVALLDDLSSLAAVLCGAQPGLAGMLVEALLVSCAPHNAATTAGPLGPAAAAIASGGGGTPHTAALHLLPPLLEEHSNAAELAAHMLVTYPQLSEGGCGAGVSLPRASARSCDDLRE